MSRFFKLHQTLIIYLLATAVSVAFANHGSRPTALDKYIQAPDPNFHYELVRTIPGQGYTAYVLDMTSQSWRTAAEVDRTLWKHWVTIVKPEQVRGTTGLLFIAGGSNN